MIKKILEKFGYILAILVIAVVSAMNMNVNSKSDGLSDMSLANVEALAKGEVVVEIPCQMGPDDFCVYPPFPGYPYWDIFYPGKFYE